MAEIGSGPTLHSSVVMLLRRKWWVITIALLGLAFSLAISLTEPDEYSATAQLLVQSTGQAINFGAQAVVTTTDVQHHHRAVQSGSAAYLSHRVSLPIVKCLVL